MTNPPNDQRLTPRATWALAALIAELHNNAGLPTWDTAGCATNLTKARATTPAIPLALAAIRGATDPTNRTPAFIHHPNNRAHDPTLCPIHGRSPRRADGECAPCWTDRCAAQPQAEQRPGNDTTRPDQASE